MGGLSRSSSSSDRWKQQQSCLVQPLTPLMEDPDLETLLGTSSGTSHDHQVAALVLLGTNSYNNNKNKHHKDFNSSSSSSSSWDQLLIRAWRKGFSGSISLIHGGASSSPAAKVRPDLMRLLLGVLGCPLAPVPLLLDHDLSSLSSILHHLPDLHGIPIEASSAHYIIQQYLAATGCLKLDGNSVKKNMYVAGSIKMVCYETEIATGKSVKTVGTKIGGNGCFVLWQMSPGMWSIELVISGGNKVVAGSNGKIVWRHTPWLGSHAAKGPRRPLRRIIQGLDPKSTANLFAKAQCLGEKRIGGEDCFVLKVASDRADVMERSEGPAEVIRHVLYGYFSQKSGLLVYMEDSHLTRVQTPAEIHTTVYWETTIGTSMGDYRDVDGILIAHQGRSVATLFRFGEASTTKMKNCRTRMEEVWRIDDVVYNVPGLSLDYFIPPSDIFDATHSP